MLEDAVNAHELWDIGREPVSKTRKYHAGRRDSLLGIIRGRNIVTTPDRMVQMAVAIVFAEALSSGARFESIVWMASNAAGK